MQPYATIETSELESSDVLQGIEITPCLVGFSNGDLSNTAKLWVEIQNALADVKLSLIPTVEAAAKCPDPPRPPPMKYTELPIYSTPHYDYKTHLETNDRCPDYNEKTIHRYLYPKVRYYKKNILESVCGMGNELITIKNEIFAICRQKKIEFKCYMRHPDNLTLRQAVVVLGGATGYYIGRGRNFPKKMFFATLGSLAAGALCFPKETDEIYRNAMYEVGKGILNIYNGFCGKAWRLREKMPCEADLPPPPKARQTTKCPPQK